MRKGFEGGRNPLCLFVCFFVSKQLALNQGGTTLKWGVNGEATRGDGEERPGLRLGSPYHSCPASSRGGKCCLTLLEIVQFY